MARLLDSILGHEKNIQVFLEAFQRGRLQNTFLFVGPAGVGKKSTAEALAQALLCERSNLACGECSSCLRVAKRQHEGLHLIEPEKTQIKIEQTRELIHFLGLQALGRRRVVIIDHAEKLNPQAGNSLLKALEEPSEGTYFFLIAPSPHHVLPTLKSRSQLISFRPLSLEHLRLKSRAPEWALRAAQGSLERVRSLMDPSEQEARALAVKMLRSWEDDPQGYLRQEFRESFRDRALAASLSKHLGFLLKDAVQWQLGKSDQLLNPDQTELFSSMSRYSLTQLLGVSLSAFRLENSFLQNRDSQLVFEEFWIQSSQSLC